MANNEMPHIGHDKHLCYLTNLDFHNKNPQEYNKLVKNAVFVCQNCGRVAENAINLCKPVKISN
ncbi:MAG: hypothetical protein A2Y12_13785 [Planctomycetes bacterium GWF2_42_9]|nr:MAG: hypothetical protein A2Y12_13785 [Planctomycetes bacterium GWF2_42_9]HAL45589.1 hypothetical protein [Phycisphaerales bacterium]